METFPDTSSLYRLHWQGSLSKPDGVGAEGCCNCRIQPQHGVLTTLTRRCSGRAGNQRVRQTGPDNQGMSSRKMLKPRLLGKKTQHTPKNTNFSSSNLPIIWSWCRYAEPILNSKKKKKTTKNMFQGESRDWFALQLLHGPRPEDKQASQPDSTLFLNFPENKVFPNSLLCSIYRISGGSFFSSILRLSDSFTLSLELLQHMVLYSLWNTSYPPLLHHQECKQKKGAKVGDVK